MIYPFKFLFYNAMGQNCSLDLGQYNLKKVSATVKEDKVDLNDLENEILGNSFLVFAAIASAVNLVVALLR